MDIPEQLAAYSAQALTTALLMLDAIGFQSAQHAIHRRWVTESVLATPTDSFLLQGKSTLFILTTLWL